MCTKHLSCAIIYTDDGVLEEKYRWKITHDISLHRFTIGAVVSNLIVAVDPAAHVGFNSSVSYLKRCTTEQLINVPFSLCIYSTVDSFSASIFLLVCSFVSHVM